MRRSRANMGRAWEAQLIVWHRAYADAGHAFVVQAPPAVKVISKPVNGRFTACWTKDGPPDFAGSAFGRGIVFDAKDCAGSRWPLSDLAPHQARDLNTAQKAGAIAFVALRLEGQGWVVPWSVLGPRWIRWGKNQAARGEASLGVAELRQIALPMDGEGWLSAVRDLIEREREAA